MSEPMGHGAEKDAPEFMVWHDEADRLAVWGTLDPPDACMCRECVLPPGERKPDYLLDGSPESVALVREARGLPPLTSDSPPAADWDTAFPPIRPHTCHIELGALYAGQRDPDCAGCRCIPPAESAEASGQEDERPVDWSRMHHGICPKCHEDKFIGHGPLCIDCCLASGQEGT